MPEAGNLATTQQVLDAVFLVRDLFEFDPERIEHPFDHMAAMADPAHPQLRWGDRDLTQGTGVPDHLVCPSPPAGGEERRISGAGNGPISALVHALRRDLGIEVEVLDYAEHALGAGEEATAVAYVEVRSEGDVRWGVGMDPNITTASMKAVLGALERFGIDLLPESQAVASVE